MPRGDLRNLTHEELEALVAELGEPKFRVKQLEEWLWTKAVRSFDEMTNLSKGLRSALAESYSLAWPEVVSKQVSEDGTHKYLLKFADGASAECVAMPSRDHLSVCVSTQAGCAMGCAFCATGMLGLERSLTAAEIYLEAMVARDDMGLRVSSVVFMGQGEPFANYDEVMRALRLFNSPVGAGIGARHLTVSTCGIIPQIARFSNEPEQFTLAISLHSAVQETRNRLMPGVRRWSLVHLHSVLVDYADKTGRRPTYEYALIAGINDTEPEIQALCDFCEGTLAHVNLITLNNVPGSPFSPSAPGKAEEVVRRLARIGVEATVRKSRGADIDAACGQLKQRIKK